MTVNYHRCAPTLLDLQIAQRRHGQGESSVGAGLWDVLQSCLAGKRITDNCEEIPEAPSQ